MNVKPAIQLRAARVTDTASSASATAQALRPYLEAWEASWRRWGIDLGRLNDDDAAFSDTPDASWDVARRNYHLAAAARSSGAN